MYLSGPEDYWELLKNGKRLWGIMHHWKCSYNVHQKWEMFHRWLSAYDATRLSNNLNRNGEGISVITRPVTSRAPRLARTILKFRSFGWSDSKIWNSMFGARVGPLVNRTTPEAKFFRAKVKNLRSFRLLRSLLISDECPLPNKPFKVIFLLLPSVESTI